MARSDRTIYRSSRSRPLTSQPLATQKIGTVGITEYAQKALGDVVFVELPVKGSEVAKQGAAFPAAVEGQRQSEADGKIGLTRFCLLGNDRPDRSRRERKGRL